MLRSCRDFINIFPKCNDHKHRRPKKGRTILEMDPRANWLLLCFNFKDDWILFGIAHIIRVLVAVVNIGDNPARFASIVLEFLKKENSNDVNRHPKNLK